MITRQKIRKLEPYLGLLPKTNDLYVGVVNPSTVKLQRIGFSENAADGDTVLPRAIGRASAYNAHGMRIVRKDLPMETAYTTVWWEWEEWDGTQHGKFVDRPYQRYPREHVAPPSLELTLFTDVNGNRVVVTPLIEDWRNNPQAVIHAVNLMLEIFGHCMFYDQERAAVITAPVRHLNWQVLPPGRHPFPKLAAQLKDVLGSVKPGKRNFADHRLDQINKYQPDFTAVGRAGFRGYVVFGFEGKNLYVLESILYGNATYIFEGDWERLSQMTKAEILNNSLQKGRVVHRESWEVSLRKELDPLIGK